MTADYIFSEPAALNPREHLKNVLKSTEIKTEAGTDGRPPQLGFSDHEQTHVKKRTRRQRFLDEMEATVPREAFLALIEPCAGLLADP